MSDDAGIPWLTDPQRDFLAYLTVLTIQPQLKPARSYARISDALGELADQGEVVLRADDDNVWVIIHGQVIVHAARDWLEWATQRWGRCREQLAAPWSSTPPNGGNGRY